MKRYLVFSFLALACSREMIGDMDIMGGPPRLYPLMMDGLSNGMAVVSFTDAYTHQVKLIDPKTGHSKDLNIGSDKNRVIALRVGWGDTIYVITLEQGHKKLHMFAPDGTPRGKHVLEEGHAFMDFLVIKSDNLYGTRIITLNTSGLLCSAYDRTGKIIKSGGPRTPPEGPWVVGWMAVAPAMGYLVIVPRYLKGGCGDCNEIYGSIRVHQWGMNTAGEEFTFIKEISLEPLFADWDIAKALAARGYDDRVYVFVHLIKQGQDAVALRVGYALIAIDPASESYEMVMNSEYEELHWDMDAGQSARLYDKEGNLVPTVMCAAIRVVDSKKLFLAFSDGHVEVCEIGP